MVQRVIIAERSTKLAVKSVYTDVYKLIIDSSLGWNKISLILSDDMQYADSLALVLRATLSTYLENRV